MRNLFDLFGTSNDRRRPQRSRAYPQMQPSERRYEMPRPEMQRFQPMPPERRRKPQSDVSWQRRGIIALSGLGVAAAIGGMGWLFQSDTFRVRVIDVQGVQIADPQAIANAAGLGGSSMIALDLEGAGREVAKLASVKSATVSRDWPNGIRIDVTEYQAWGYWQAGPQRLVIDETGRVLEQARPPAADAPTIVEVASAAPAGQGVSTDPDTVQLVHRLRTDGTFDRLKVKPTSFVFRRDRGLTVIVADGPSAVLGDSSNYEFKVRTWQALLEQVRAGAVPQIQGAPAQVSAAPGARAGQQSAVASEIDLRFGRNVVLR